jgi:RNA-directed DNA polymerase
MHDRALQALLKMVIEPEWEAKFEPNSYGFRPGRSAHDAVEAIFLAIAQKSKFVLDADMAQCFDKISHEELLRKMNTFTLAGRVILFRYSRQKNSKSRPKVNQITETIKFIH